MTLNEMADMFDDWAQFTAFEVRSKAVQNHGAVKINDQVRVESLS